MSVQTKNNDRMVHAKSHPAVRINSKRFEQSPYAEATLGIFMRVALILTVKMC